MAMNLLLILQSMVLAAIAAVGFAMVFNVPARYLKYCAILGAVGNGLRTIFTLCGLSIEWATLLAALAVGALSIIMAYKHALHPKVISVAAVIPMCPGVSAYTAMIALIKLSQLGYTPELMDQLVTNFLRASFIVGSLSLGLALPSVWIYRRKMRAKAR